jgi:hypothetical protein
VHWRSRPGAGPVHVYLSKVWGAQSPSTSIYARCGAHHPRPRLSIQGVGRTIPVHVYLSKVWGAPSPSMSRSRVARRPRPPPMAHLASCAASMRLPQRCCCRRLHSLPLSSRQRRVRYIAQLILFGTHNRTFGPYLAAAPDATLAAVPAAQK